MQVIGVWHVVLVAAGGAWGLIGPSLSQAGLTAEGGLGLVGLVDWRLAEAVLFASAAVRPPAPPSNTHTHTQPMGTPAYARSPGVLRAIP